MSLTKRQICEQAFGELALVGHVFDLAPEEMETALGRLDAMMAQWDGDDIRVGYKLPDPLVGSALDDDSGVPDAARLAIFTNLAVLLAPLFGKEVAPSTASTAARTYQALSRASAIPRPLRMPDSMPTGTGNRPWSGRAYFPSPDTGPLDTDDGGNLTIIPK